MGSAYPMKRGGQFAYPDLAARTIEREGFEYQ